MKKSNSSRRDRFYEALICPFSAIIISMSIIEDIEGENVPSGKLMLTHIFTAAIFLSYSLIQKKRLKPQEKDLVYYLNFVCASLLTLCTAILFFQNYLP